MSTKVGNVELLLGPHSIDPALDNLEHAIVEFIDGAQKKLEIAVQELESRPIAEAILRAEIERKVQVKLVLEADYLVATKRPKTVADAFDAKGKHEPNRELTAALLRSTVWLRSDFNAKIFHQKFIIRDGTSVLTGSTNFTPTGVGTSHLGGNLNHLVIVHDQDFAKIYGREFREISKGHFGKFTIDRNKKPKTVIVSGLPLKVCFAPDHNPEMEIMKQMAKARERIDFAIFTFSQSSGIDDAMKLAARAGIDVAGALESSQGNQDWAATRGLLDSDIVLRQVGKKAKLNKLHHKLMTIDDRVMIVGSFNYTGAANNLNDENIVVIGQADTDAAKPLVLAARNEIERIMTVHGTKFQ